MNNPSDRAQLAQKPTKTASLFNLFLYRQQIASNIPGTKALRIKRRNPAVIVKFSHMQGGAV